MSTKGRWLLVLSGVYSVCRHSQHKKQEKGYLHQPVWIPTNCHNCGRIFFFILSFFIGYILSFGLVRLRTFRLNARVGAHIERRRSHSCGEDVTITDVIIKTPDSKCDWGCEWCHARKRWTGILGYFWKKELAEIWDWTKQVGIQIWVRLVQLFAVGCVRICWVSELRADAGQTVSIVKIVSLS